MIQQEIGKHSRGNSRSESRKYVKAQYFLVSRPGSTPLSMASRGTRGYCAVKMLDESTDESEAKITYQEGKWSWTLWECLLDVHNAKADIERRGAEHKLTLLCRARDKKGEEQKRDCAWNMRGVAFNAYGKWVWRW